MNMKNAKRAMATSLAIIAFLALGQSAHAQTVSGQWDRPSYVPGDSGTLTIYVVNDNAQGTLEIRNITVYFPWAGLHDGKWDGANVSINLSPWKVLNSQGSPGGTNVYSTSLGFTIPSWYQVYGQGSGGFCNPNNRYGTYHGCILVGITANNPRYESQSLDIGMALPTYTPVSLVAQWLPIATLVVLVVATAFLGMAWMSLRRTAKKA